MSEDIKEILDKAKEISDYGADNKQHTRMFNQFEAKALLDYITNLQEENEFLKLSNPEMNMEHFRIVKENKRKIDNLRKENKRLNNIINEFDKFLFGELQTYGGGGTVQEYYDKLQELKGSDKE